MKCTVVYIFSAFLTLCGVGNAFSQKSPDRYEAYIDRYYTLAQEQQQQHRIPASITLAQGLLESAAGESQLAVEAKNHFGIKCHDWEGEGIEYKGDCYRKYDNEQQSYQDHSSFLLRPRYQELYSLDITDYQGWAEGLKRLGYAEDPQYANKLISLIERYELNKYVQEAVPEVEATVDEVAAADSASCDDEKKNAVERSVYNAWDLLYVEAREGDTYHTIAVDMGCTAKALAKYNEKSVDAPLQAGEIVYLEKKHRKAVEGCDVHTVVNGETFHSISQMYGIEYRRLARRNRILFTEAVEPGTVLKLR